MILGNVSQYPFKSLLKGDDPGEQDQLKWDHENESMEWAFL